MKAVIKSGNKQYIVSVGDLVDIDFIAEAKGKLNFEPLLLIDDKEVSVGTPNLNKHIVTADVIGDTKGDKVLAIRFKAKKRVKKVRGHRQKYTQIRITDIK